MASSNVYVRPCQTDSSSYAPAEAAAAELRAQIEASITESGEPE